MTLSHLWIAQIRIKDIIQRLNGQNESMQFTHELSRSVIKSIDVIVYKDFERSYKLQVETFYKINQHASETAHRCQEWHLVKPLDILKQTMSKAISQVLLFAYDIFLRRTTPGDSLMKQWGKWQSPYQIRNKAQSQKKGDERSTKRVRAPYLCFSLATCIWNQWQWRYAWLTSRPVPKGGSIGLDEPPSLLKVAINTSYLSLDVSRKLWHLRMGYIIHFTCSYSM